MKWWQVTRKGLFVLGAAAAGLGAKAVATRDVTQMARSASAFLESLSPQQRTRATFAFDGPERLRFHFVPTEVFERHGLPIGDLSDVQRDRARDLLRSGLSQRGYMTATQIMEAEGILQMLEGTDRQFRRDPQEYLVSVFGTPSTDGTWGWRFEGHHLSLHFTIVGGKATVSSPTFLGANPAEVPIGARRGMRPLARQEDAGRALLGSLDPAQRDIAIIDDVAPADIVSRVALDIDPLAPVGIRDDALSPAQRELLMDIVVAFTSVMSDDIAAIRMRKIREAGVENIAFAWAGGTKRGEISYFRVQGPTFLIEYDNTMNDANHVHTAWREFGGELGRDLLGEHVRSERR
jgi:Protein of unknown function (DUF3500)